ncbi:MAG TPA: cbb3-type cytochrome c oxidase subunit 3 [Falsiroseomonas sp.]|jgi:cytochrome c oxidase cbb3-type subunit 4|nr:cbb3-type cytochrome c oxidase subunit 3 [Falsiroseomonas sp.]
MLETLSSLQSTFSTLWVVWFFILFAGIILYVMSPWRKKRYERAGEIPLHDEPPSPRAPPARPDQS